MARRPDDEHERGSSPRRHSPARTPEERESVLISKSLRLIEEQIDDGSVSATVLAMYGKLASSREKLEQERMEQEIQVLKKKVTSMEAAVDLKNMMEEALGAFRGYTGEDLVDETDHDDFDERY